MYQLNQFWCRNDWAWALGNSRHNKSLGCFCRKSFDDAVVEVAMPNRKRSLRWSKLIDDGFYWVLSPSEIRAFVTERFSLEGLLCLCSLLRNFHNTTLAVESRNTTTIKRLRQKWGNFKVTAFSLKNFGWLALRPPQVYFKVFLTAANYIFDIIPSMQRRSE